MDIYKKVHADAESAYKATLEIRDFLEKEVVPVLHAQVKTSPFEEALGGLYFRMVLLGRSLAKLNEPHDFQTVRAGARTAFELYLDIHHLARDPGLAEKMFAFTEVWKFNSAKKMLAILADHPELDRPEHRHQKALASDKESQKKFDELLARYWPSVKGGKKNVPSDWSGRDIYAKAREAGAEFELEYRDEYGIGSLFVHSGVVVVDNMSHEALVNAYARGHLLFQETYLKASTIVCRAFHVLDAKPALRTRLRDLENAH